MKVNLMKSTTVLPLVVFLASLTISGLAKADIILTIRDADFATGGAGAVDVLISSSTGTDKLGKFSTSFAITQLSGTGVLSFRPSYSGADPSNPANQNALERTSSDPAYVFAGNLGVGFASVSNGTRQTILQVDRASSDVTLSTTPVLLARLELLHTTPTLDQAAAYRIELQNNASTSFQLLDNSFVTISPTFFNSTGTISVSAVPEPASCLLLGLSGAWFMLHKRRVPRSPSKAT